METPHGDNALTSRSGSNRPCYGASPKPYQVGCWSYPSGGHRARPPHANTKPPAANSPPAGLHSISGGLHTGVGSWPRENLAPRPTYGEGEACGVWKQQR